MTFPKKILLVDYEPRVTAMVRRALEATGKYIIKEEHNTKLAVNAARFFQPHLILFDVLMSRPEGDAVARELQADPSFKDTPVVFLGVNTTSAEASIASGGILSGYSFLANPVRLDEFVRCVAELLKPAEQKKSKAPQPAVSQPAAA